MIYYKSTANSKNLILLSKKIKNYEKIALLNSVYRGGKTYLEYLKNVLADLLKLEKSSPPVSNRFLSTGR